MFFCIPLLPKVKADNWKRVGFLLNGTLRSLAQQSSRKFEILLAAHEIPPNVDFQGLPVSVVKPDWAPSLSFRRDPFKDKRYKKMLLGSEVRKRGGGYTMLLDADDRVSKYLVEAVYRDADEHGYIVDKGYAYDFWRQVIAPLPGAWPNPFYHYCGSCAVLNLKEEDLPRSTRDDSPSYFSTLRSHTKWKETSESFGRPLRALDFPAVAYFQNTGENNHRKVNMRQDDQRTAALNAAATYLSPSLSDEFALGDDLDHARSLRADFRPVRSLLRRFGL